MSNGQIISFDQPASECVVGSRRSPLDYWDRVYRSKSVSELAPETFAATKGLAITGGGLTLVGSSSDSGTWTRPRPATFRGHATHAISFAVLRDLFLRNSSGRGSPA